MEKEEKRRGEEEEFFSPPPVEVGEEEIEEIRERVYRGLSPEMRMRAEEVKSAIEYILEPYIPKEHKKEFEEYEFFVSKNLALANIPPELIPRYLTYFDLVCLWLKVGEADVAMKRMARFGAELQLTRSIGGFERLAQITSRQVVEEAPKIGEEKKGGLFSWWRRGKEE